MYLFRTSHLIEMSKTGNDLHTSRRIFYCFTHVSLMAIPIIIHNVSTSTLIKFWDNRILGNFKYCIAVSMRPICIILSILLGSSEEYTVILIWKMMLFCDGHIVKKRYLSLVVRSDFSSNLVKREFLAYLIFCHVPVLKAELSVLGSIDHYR